MIAAWLAGCFLSDHPAPIDGTTYRVDADVPAESSEIRIDALTSYAECAGAKVDDIEACLPRADRASGELHFSFVLRDPTSLQDLPRAVKADQIKVTHDRAIQSGVELVPHEPMASGQLFVLLIDGSGSMYEKDGERIRKVWSALLKKSVIDGFYPGGSNKSGVVLLRFSDKVVGIDGGKPQVLTTRQEYEAAVREHLLRPSGGYTHLYGAVRYAITELLDQPEIQTFVTVRGAEPSVILVSDGFNNEARTDTCATNVPKLQSLIDLIREVRTTTGSSVRPTVYAVGLGKAYRKGDKPEGLNRQVTPAALCGPYADYPIDPSLEDEGIDHVSMRWIAEAGGGRSFVRSKANGLAEVLESAAATRYRWYELWYRVPDNFYHRKSFEVQLQLDAIARATTSFRVFPNAWLDAPTARREEGGAWHRPSPFADSLAILLPALGAVVVATYLGPALFNARRALFRRARPRAKKR
ncbi:MAG: vWA domain-containing protein [Myxococcota bacterium]